MKRSPTYLYAAGDSIRGDTIILTGPEFHHVARVLRLNRDDEAVIVDGRGGLYRTRVAEVTAAEARFDIRERGDGDAAELKRELVLAQGLVRRDEWSEILAGCTQVGVSGFIPFRTARSLIRPRAFGGTAAATRWQKILISAIKQCGRAWLPWVEPPLEVAELVRRSKRFDTCLVAYEKATSPLKQAWSESGGDGPVLVAVGPAGGFAEAEIESLKAAGFKAFSLGPRRLRAGTAALVTAALVADLIGSRG